MSETKQPEGFIPAGLVVETLYGTLEGGLRIAGEVEHVELQAGRLHVAGDGVMKDGQVDAENVIIDGRVSGVTFTTPRLKAGAGARISDCVIEMESPTGCAIHEEARFEGEVRISVSGKGDGKGNSQGNSKGAAGSATGKADSAAGGKAADAGREGDEAPAGDDEPDPHWPEQTPDISEASRDAAIPLGG